MTLVQDGFDDDSVRGTHEVFEFTRVPCGKCTGGMSPWTLDSLEVAQRCWEDRSHEYYSAQACN